MKGRILILGGFIILAALACRVSSPLQQSTAMPVKTQILRPTDPPIMTQGERIYEDEHFSFTIPPGWKTQEEVWGRPMPEDADHYGLGVINLITIQYPGGQGEGKAFFSVSSSPLAGGVDLEGRFTRAYENAVPEIKEASRQPYQQYGLAGFEITYDRPWGEPWWRFHDIWLEKDAVIYVLTFQAYPTSYDEFTDVFGEIADSFRFKE